MAEIAVKKAKSWVAKKTGKQLSFDELKNETMNHIKDVQTSMRWIAYQITLAGNHHDQTKINNMEEYYKAFYSGHTGKTDYFTMHKTKERHHLKEYTPPDVTLIDVIEYICDCTCAAAARSNKMNDISLPADTLQRAFNNTISLLQKHITVTESAENTIDESVEITDLDDLYM